MLNAAMRTNWGRLAVAVLGALIYALGINLFVAPLGLITGGLMGLCQLLRSVILMALGIQSMQFELAGVIMYAFNVPLLILAYRSMGKVFFRNTLICSTAYSLFASIVPVPAVPIVEDMLTGCWGASSPGPVWASPSPAAAAAAAWICWGCIWPSGGRR